MYGLFSSERIIRIKFDNENFIQENVSSKIINQISHNLTGELRDFNKPVISNLDRSIRDIKQNLSPNTFSKLIRKLREKKC